MDRHICLLVPILAVVGIAMAAGAALGQDPAAQAVQQASASAPGRLSSFRMDTDIYSDIAKPPIKQSLTLFSNGIFYDISGDEAQRETITVIDPARKRIILLDPRRKVRMEWGMDTLDKMLQQTRLQMNPQQSQWLGPATIADDPQSGELVVKNGQLEYRCVPQQPPQADIAAQYAEFADWSARLNAIDPPFLPPFIRIETNQAIAARQLLPKELSRIARQGRKETKLIARHLANWRLSSDDQIVIERIGRMMVEFKTVSREEFQHGPK
jgi:hypothetical protein